MLALSIAMWKECELITFTYFLIQSIHTTMLSKTLKNPMFNTGKTGH